MNYKYEIYNCNNGNPTAIITNCDNEKIYKNIAEKIYEIHPEVDQAVVILEVKGKKCVFQLVNGEFCGNACLAISAFMYENYKIKDANIVNKIINENGEIKCIKIESRYDGKSGNLIIPQSLFLTLDKFDAYENGIIKMNGIEHLIIPRSYGKMNEEYAKKKIEEIEKKGTMPDVLGLIFLENNKIDPFIWIRRIRLLQHQTSCLSGSIAALQYLHKREKRKENLIIQPTGETYDIKFRENYIDITGIIRKIKLGSVEV